MADISAAIQAVRRLHPHPDRYAKARWIPNRNRYEFPIRPGHLDDKEIAAHVQGKHILGAVASDAESRTTVVGLDLDAHMAGQNPGRAAVQFVRTAQALDVPCIVHSSKSGKGAHIRTLFSESVPGFLARALYVAIVLAAGLSADKAVDKVWPPVHGLGVLALPYNAQCANAAGGTLALNPNTMQPLPKEAQLSCVLDAHDMTRGEVEDVLRSMGVFTEGQAALLAGQARATCANSDGTRVIKDGVDGGVKHMLSTCEAVKRFQDEATSVSYEFWFGMMTNFRPFIGGKDLFTAISELDPKRFDQRVIENSWKAIRGGPRLCTHLDTGWECPMLGTCQAKSPAGLPFALRREGRV